MLFFLDFIQRAMKVIEKIYLIMLSAENCTTLIRWNTARWLLSVLLDPDSGLSRIEHVYIVPDGTILREAMRLICL